MATKEKGDVRDEIMEYLKTIERNLRWLSTKCEYNYNTMYSTFVQKVIELSEDKLQKINSVLKTKFKK
jgi:hypothetical protein